MNPCSTERQRRDLIPTPGPSARISHSSHTNPAQASVPGVKFSAEGIALLTHPTP
ncbi:hypothetical protein ACQ9LF_05105 [Anaerohalosphaeraceae bacterium U12dextr]